MRKIFFALFIVLILFFIFGARIYAQTKNLDKTATPENQINKNSSDTPQVIQNLKDKIATKVAELRNSKKRIIKGTVYSIEGNEITIIDAQKQIYTSAIDDLTDNLYRLSSGVRTKIKKDDIKKDSEVLAYGSIVESSLTLDRLYVYSSNIYFDGRIQKVNTDYSIEVVSTNGTIKIFDIESNTKQKLLDKKNVKTITSGFSKYKEGDYVMAEYKSDIDSTRSAALRTILIPQEAIE